MPFVERTIQGYGIVIDEIHYYSDVLRRFINAADPADPRRKRHFIFKRDPRDISQIYFYDPELKQYSRIPYRNTAHPPISIWELREVRRQLTPVCICIGTVNKPKLRHARLLDGLTSEDRLGL